ncbi:MAG: HalOD1 output domain-containing protein [Haloarculaceae archaeon]
MTDRYRSTTDARHRIASTEHHAFHDWRSSRPVTETLLTALADVPGVDPTSGEPIGRLIDVEAVEQLFAARGARRLGGRATVEFPYDGHVITIASDGRITITPQQSR